MSAKFSPSTKGVYPVAVFESFPPDALDIPEELYEKFCNGEVSGFAVRNAIVIETVAEVTLDKLKQAKIAEITAAFSAEIKAGFAGSSGIKMNFDITDVQRLKSAYDLTVLINQTALLVIVDYDNAIHANMPLAEVHALIIEMGWQYEILYIKKNTLRSQAMAASNQTELDLITWS